jgi:hypothetical protein
MKFVNIRAISALCAAALAFAGAGCSAAGQGASPGPLEKANLIVDDFPTAIDPVRLQRVVDDMIQFGFLPKKDASFNISSIVYNGNLASTTGPGTRTPSIG